jgi:Skp family chaperone for outer membrane proteins
MKNVFLLILALMMILPVSALAEGQSNVAVLDMRRLVDESDAGKSIGEKLSARHDSLQKEASEYEKKIRDQEKSLLQERKKLKPEEFETKKKEFEKNFKDSREKILKKSNDLEAARRKAVNQLQTHIAEITADIADTRKLDLVVDRDAVVISAKNIEITDEVLKRLNEKVKDIPLSMGAGGN